MAVAGSWALGWFQSGEVARFVGAGFGGGVYEVGACAMPMYWLVYLLLLFTNLSWGLLCLPLLLPLSACSCHSCCCLPLHGQSLRDVPDLPTACPSSYALLSSSRLFAW